MIAAAAALWTVTAYCASYACGALGHGITASGVRAVEGYTAACPPELPIGTRLVVEGLGVRVCEDRGSAIVGARLDVYLGSATEPDRGLARARAWGIQRRRVQVLWRPDVPVRVPPWYKPGCPRER